MQWNGSSIAQKRNCGMRQREAAQKRREKLTENLNEFTKEERQMFKDLQMAALRLVSKIRKLEEMYETN